ncbi:SDR family oxidoreductase [Nannocystis pusilla]|uniref:SDR family oxidoreductase n=1 Tax=Nannocystis pusilla TaxID=889268 RepID=A0ABS7U3B9_9BACT|nr:SDR family oxidoreductase [Nannocystis pusilla]MBZ5714911.1 SDR family oxidoreductase [Nannocystis pusilla]
MPQPLHASCFRPDVLAGRVALVTGGGSGIGAAIAARLAEHGARVAICGRTQAKLDAMVGEIEAAGGEALGHVADVRRFEQVEQVMQALEARWGRLDILVNNAAGNFLCPAVGLSPNGFGTVIDIDLKGTFNASKAAFPLLSRAGGVIINISATLHYAGTPLQTHAASAKAGIDALTRSLAMEWGPAGIRINGIAPGPIDGTEGITRLLAPELRERAERLIPLRRFGSTAEVADAALFLASPASAYVTGAVLVVDGGQWLAGSMALAQ